MKKFLPGLAGGILGALLFSAWPALASLAEEALTSISITSASGLSGAGTVDSPLAFTGTTTAAISTSAAAPQFACSLATATCESRSYTNGATASATVAAHTIAPNAALGANDLLFQSFDVTGGTGVVKWDEDGDMTVKSLTIQTNSSVVLDPADSNSYIYRSAANKIQFGDGVTPTVSAGLYSSEVTDATTSGTVGAITLKSGADITATDLLLDVQDSAGAHAFTLTESGAGVFLNNLTVATGNYVCLNAGCSANIRDNGGTLTLTPTTNITLNSNSTLAVAMTLNSSGTALTISGNGNIDVGTKTAGSCTLNAASPSVCTATVTAASICTCSKVGTTAAIAATGCAVSVSGTTLTVTSANGESGDVNYHCFL